MKLTKNILSDEIRHLQLKEPLLVEPSATIHEAILRMQSAKEGYTLIADDDGRLCGIFTERDVLRRVIGEEVDMDSPVSQVMTTQLATLSPADGVAKAFLIFHERGLRHLPVIDADGRAVGLLSVRQLFEYVVDHFPSAVYNQPPNASTVFGSREGA